MHAWLLVLRHGLRLQGRWWWRDVLLSSLWVWTRHLATSRDWCAPPVRIVLHHLLLLPLLHWRSIGIGSCLSARPRAGGI